MKLVTKFLSATLMLGIVCSSAVSTCVFAGGDEESGIFTFGSNAFGSGTPLFRDKQEDIMFEEPLRWGDKEILGIACDWEKTDSFGRDVRMPQSIAASKLLRGILTNNLSLVRQGVEEGAQITQPIQIVTSDRAYDYEYFDVPDVKHCKGVSREIVDYLRKAYNGKRLSERKSARRYGYGINDSSLFISEHSKEEVISLFDGEVPLKIEADEVDKISEPIDFLDTKIVGFIKDWCSAFRPLDKDMCEKLVRGILTENLDMVKSAVESGKIKIGMFPVVTSEGKQVNFEPFREAVHCKNKEIADYLKRVQDEQMKFYFAPRPVGPTSPVSFGGFIPSIPGK